MTSCCTDRALTLRVFVLGAGRAGRALARALAAGAGGVEVVGLAGRGTSLTADTIGRADVVLVTVRDGQLETALAQLYTAPLAPGAIVLHASGSADPESALDQLRRAGHAAGTFHPLVPLADEHRAAVQLRGAWVGVDGDAAAQRAGRVLADALGAHVLTIPRGAKPRYHAAAVLASNFPVVLAAVAAEVMRNAGIDGEAARGAVQRLMQAAVENLATAAPETVLTGPVARGDEETVAKHLAALEGDPEVADAYRALTRLARRLVR